MLEFKGKAYPDMRLVPVEIYHSLAVAAAELGKNSRQEDSLVAEPVGQVKLKIVVLEGIGRVYLLSQGFSTSGLLTVWVRKVFILEDCCAV